jgi:hypothetical protein
VSEEQPNPSVDLSKWQIGVYMETYRHHWEIFIKAVILYFAVIGSVVGYVFGVSAASHSSRRVLALAASIVSVFAMWCCVVSYAWVSYLERLLEQAWRSLGLEPFSLLAAKRIITVAMVLSVGFFVAGLMAYLFLR